MRMSIWVILEDGLTQAVIPASSTDILEHLNDVFADQHHIELLGELWTLDFADDCFHCVRYVDFYRDDNDKWIMEEH